jgi:hypothetical protein
MQRSGSWAVFFIFPGLCVLAALLIFPAPVGFVSPLFQTVKVITPIGVQDKLLPCKKAMC